MTKVKTNKRYLYRHKWAAYGMIAPGFILLTIFVIIPFIMALYKSFTDKKGVQFVWFDNYVRILQEDRFFQSLGNVVLMTLIYTAIMVIIAFAFSLAVQKLSSKMASVTKIIIYIPFLISGIVLSIIFNFIFSSQDYGLINALRTSAGLPTISFQKSGIWPYFIIIFPMLWGGFGYNALVMLAGLLNIPKDYHEAAEIDGANAWEKLIHITLPNMKNYFLLIVVNLITGGLQMFEIPMMMTNGGPSLLTETGIIYKTLTPVLFIFQLEGSSAITEPQKVAGSILIMIPIALINILVFKVLKSEKNNG